MSVNKFRWLNTLGFGLLFVFGSGFGQSVIGQEEGEAKGGGRETIPTVEPSREERKAAIAEMEKRVQEAAERRNAQEAKGAPVQVVGNPFGLEPPKMKAAKRFQLEQFFQVELELIERLCEPTPQQLAKLRVGAKGAVKKLTDEWWKSAARRFGGVEMDQAAQDRGDDAGQQGEESDSAEEEASQIKDANEIDNTISRMVMMEGARNPMQANLPTEEKSWSTLVASVLTAEQSAKLATYKTEQSELRRQEMLGSIVGMLSRELRLAPETKQKLLETLKPHFDTAEIQCISFYEPYLGYYIATKATNEELAAFLSPAQIQSMRMLLWPSREIERMMGRQ